VKLFLVHLEIVHSYEDLVHFVLEVPMDPQASVRVVQLAVLEV